MAATTASRAQASAPASPFAAALEHALALYWRAMRALAVAERRVYSGKGTYASGEILADGTVFLSAHGARSTSPRSAHQELAQVVHLQEAQAHAREAFDLCAALLRSVPGCATAPLKISCHNGTNAANPPVALILDNVPFQNERAVQAGLLARRLDAVRGMLAALDWSGPAFLWSADNGGLSAARHAFTAPDVETAALKRFLLICGDSPVEALRRRGDLSFYLPMLVPHDDVARQKALIAQVLATQPA